MVFKALHCLLFQLFNSDQLNTEKGRAAKVKAGIISETNHEDGKQLFINHYVVYCFNFSTLNQCLPHCIQI